MNLLLLSSIVCALTAAASSVLVVRFAAVRAAAQPPDGSVDAEDAVVAAALRHPAWLADGDELTGDMFLQTDRGRLWDAARAWWTTNGEGIGDGPLSDAVIAQLEADADVPAGTAVQVSSVPAVDHAGYLEAGTVVLTAEEGRRMFTGRSVTSLDDDGTVVRTVAPSGTSRIPVVAAVLAVAGGAGPALLPEWVTSPAAVVAFAVAYATLVWLSVHIALVDHDTMCADYETLAPAGAVIWTAAVVTAALAGAGGFAVVVAVATVAVAALMRAAAWWYRRTRGVDGFGRGDIYGALVLLGGPALLAGDATMLANGFLAASVLGLITYVVRRAAGVPHTSATVFAFLPMLGAGWWVAWVALETGATDVLTYALGAAGVALADLLFAL